MKIRIDKDKIKRVLPFLACVLVAFLVWLYVMYTSAPECDYEIKNIQVYTTELPERFKDCEIDILTETVSPARRLDGRCP